MLSGLRKVWDERLKKIYRVVGHPSTVKVAKLLKDAVVAQQFMQDRGMWKRTSLFWAQHFANAPDKKDEDFEKAFLKVIEMGVDSKKALDALRRGSLLM